MTTVLKAKQEKPTIDEVKQSVREIACEMTSEQIQQKVNKLLDRVLETEVKDELLLMEIQCYSNIVNRRQGVKTRDNL